MSSSVSERGGGGGAAAVLPSTEPTRRQLTARQAETVQSLVDAAVVEVRDTGYDGLTVRNVARRAGVAPATAYTYFASKDHLITEVFWRRLQALPDTATDRRRTPANRVVAAVGDIALLVADEPELAAACTVSMLGSDPDVGTLRDRIGAEMHRRVAEALGDDADPAVQRSIDLALTGALVQAGMGHLTYVELPDRLAELIRLVLGGDR